MSPCMYTGGGLTFSVLVSCELRFDTGFSSVVELIVNVSRIFFGKIFVRDNAVGENIVPIFNRDVWVDVAHSFLHISNWR